MVKNANFHFRIPVAVPATATPSPPAASVREEDVPLPQPLVYENLGKNYAAPSKDPQRRRSVTLSANNLASEVLQRLIREKEELTFGRDQFLAERDQTAARLSKLEAKAAEAVVLEAQAKAKWAEVHGVVLAASDREAASAERLTNLEAALNSKTEEVAPTGVKYDQLEEKYMKTIEHNRIFSSTVHELDVSLKSIRFARENLSAEVIQLKELKSREASLVVEKPYVMYNMRRKILEEAKADVIDFDAEIAKARELESAAKRGLPAEPDAFDSSGSGFESSETEEEPEGEDIEGQTNESQDIEPSADLSTSLGGANASLPPGFRDVAV
ncbi:uncharacterized protein [Nicotiana tomentosiformis]|uniref:uncharacterized protein n=1 Tax=Nicotiana tomentosiformis TaxID=4098 RepID=UPI00388C6BAB